MPNSARPMRLGLLFQAILLTGITANVEANIRSLECFLALNI